MLTVDFKQIPLKAGMGVLDAGCGSGRHLCEAFRTPGVAVVGVDLKWDDLCKAKGFLALMAGNRMDTGWSPRRHHETPFADGSLTWWSVGVRGAHCR